MLFKCFQSEMRFYWLFKHVDFVIQAIQNCTILRFNIFALPILQMNCVFLLKTFLIKKMLNFPKGTFILLYQKKRCQNLGVSVLAVDVVYWLAVIEE